MSRLDQLIAHNLSLSRKQVLQLFKQHRISNLDGSPTLNPSANISEDQLPLSLLIDRRQHNLLAQYHLLMNKPVGFVTSTHDPIHRTAHELLKEQPFADRLVAIGRLDLDTNGLLLWTSNGTLVHRLSHPKQSISRIYHVALENPWKSPPIDFQLRDGHRPKILELNSLNRSQCHPALSVPSNVNHFASITLDAGKYHEVKRIFAALDSHVAALTRVAYGPFLLPPELPAGQCVAVDLTSMLDET